MATRGAEPTGGEIDRTTLKGGVQHEGFLRYRRLYWAKMAGAISATLIVAYLLIDIKPRPNGGSWFGYTLGTAGVLLIVWLAFLGVRKRAMTPGRWSLKAWTSAHVYLGLSLIVIGTLHTGFQLGWNVHTLAWVLMMIVILSGLFGITAYTTLPGKLSTNRDETTEAQMLETLADINRQLFDAAQPLEAGSAAVVQRAIDENAFSGGIWRRLSSRQQIGGTAEALAEFRARSSAGDSPLDTLYDRLEALLSRKQAALARVRRHLRIKGLLQVWLYIHVPVTFALLAALSAHIISVFFYW
ncbi:hypothetical protein [Parasphingopyxis marina]|uniref:Ferric reductase like transmembrane component n=1 Tax=Parasphingopyxis marina TaxID=2761622 RepID=A0A842I068_9SPHN|nr:hypothetical protein [Parasphingopyxis marina]MBC2778051.1 hypothetical protein [Parasphingopyxis marina]